VWRATRWWWQRCFWGIHHLRWPIKVWIEASGDYTTIWTIVDRMRVSLPRRIEGNSFPTRGVWWISLLGHQIQHCEHKFLWCDSISNPSNVGSFFIPVFEIRGKRHFMGFYWNFKMPISKRGVVGIKFIVCPSQGKPRNCSNWWRKANGIKHCLKPASPTQGSSCWP